MSEPVADQIPPCPECGSEYTYESGSSVICPMCGHEWSPAEGEAEPSGESARVVKDAVGNVLADALA